MVRHSPSPLRPSISIEQMIKLITASGVSRAFNCRRRCQWEWRLSAKCAATSQKYTRRGGSHRRIVHSHTPPPPPLASMGSSESVTAAVTLRCALRRTVFCIIHLAKLLCCATQLGSAQFATCIVLFGHPIEIVIRTFVLLALLPTDYSTPLLESFQSTVCLSVSLSTTAGRSFVRIARS